MGPLLLDKSARDIALIKRERHNKEQDRRR